jgi:tyrosinase
MGGNWSAGWIAGANGDMGENNTAAFDPIFYFHHCFIDLWFWKWQNLNRDKGYLDTLDIIPEYPGTNSIDSQGPTPGIAGNVWLTMDTPLAPFTNKDGSPMTSKDVVNIGKLGYSYERGWESKTVSTAQRATTAIRPVPTSSGSSAPRGSPGGDDDKWLLLDDINGGASKRPPPTVPIVRVTGLNRAVIPGSFVIAVRAVVDGEERVVGTESVLSRWQTAGCANCQLHLGVKAFIPLVGLDWSQGAPSIEIKVQTRGKGPADAIGGQLKPTWHFGELRPL